MRGVFLLLITFLATRGGLSFSLKLTFFKIVFRLRLSLRGSVAQRLLVDVAELLAQRGWLNFVRRCSGVAVFVIAFRGTGSVFAQAKMSCT